MVSLSLALAGYVWFHPATRELAFGNAATMVGDASDSITNVWQYQLVLDTWRRSPHELLYGAIYSDQLTYPDGYGIFIPYSERLIVLCLAPFLRVELMPTAVVWTYVVMSGLAMYSCARLFGWSRAVGLALAIAWSISPHTRARSECHIALVGVYFAPLAVAALHILARGLPGFGWSRLRETLLAAVLLLAAASAAHYYLMLLVGLSPLFALLYALLLPPADRARGARLRAALRLALAAAPALVLVITTGLAPLPSKEAALAARSAAPAEAVRTANANSLHIYGAYAEDFVAGDVRFGDRDVLGARAEVTRGIRAVVLGNFHERTNGIRWTVLGGLAVLALVLSSRRLRERVLDADERRLGAFVLLFAVGTFLLSLGPSGVRHHERDLGPVLLLARVLPAFRVANRVGVLVHFAALLASGIVATAALRRLESVTRLPRLLRKELPGLALLVLVIVEYLPLHPVVLAPVARRRVELDPAPLSCGAGITVPYVTYGFQADHYYWTMAEIRGTSCKILHAIYLTPEDEALRAKLSTRTFSPDDLERTLAFARCTRASWAVFRLDAPESYKADFCRAMGWSFVAPDACRGPANEGEPRPVRECVP